MPVRTTPFRAALHFQFPASAASGCTRLKQHQHQRIFFHSSPVRRDDIDNKNHYEMLNVQTNASPADIKKYFHSLLSHPRPRQPLGWPPSPPNFFART